MVISNYHKVNVINFKFYFIYKNKIKNESRLKMSLVSYVLVAWVLEQLHQLMYNCAKWKKGANFTQFEQKNTHINGCKIVHLCTIATVTVHICTVRATTSAWA